MSWLLGSKLCLMAAAGVGAVLLYAHDTYADFLQSHRDGDHEAAQSSGPSSAEDVR